MQRDDPYRMLRGMSGRTWLDWQEYMRLSPPWTERWPYFIAQIVKMLDDSRVQLVTRGKRTNPHTIYDYLNAIRFGDQPETLPPGPRRARAGQGDLLRAIFLAGAKPKKQDPPLP